MMIMPRGEGNRESGFSASLSACSAGGSMARGGSMKPVPTTGETARDVVPEPKPGRIFFLGFECPVWLRPSRS